MLIRTVANYAENISLYASGKAATTPMMGHRRRQIAAPVLGWILRAKAKQPSKFPASNKHQEGKKGVSTEVVERSGDYAVGGFFVHKRLLSVSGRVERGDHQWLHKAQQYALLVHVETAGQAVLDQLQCGLLVLDGGEH